MEQPKLEVLLDDFLGKGKTTREKVKNTLTDELFIGICAPIGSMKDEVIASLSKILKEVYDYEIQILKLADYIEDFKINNYVAKEGKTEAFSKLIGLKNSSNYAL